jgi:hypothetical protein
VALAKDMRQVAAREAFFKAKAEFQKRCPPITKSKTARIVSRTGASYTYSYAALDEIIAKVDPLLSELGFSKAWKQRPEKDGVSANCVLSHEQGHEEESGFITMPIASGDGRMNGSQQVGSALTYARRYSLLAVLGLAPEDDDDAQGTEGRSHGEAVSGAGERASGRTRSGVVTQAVQGDSSRSPRGGGPDSDKVETEITVPSDPDAEARNLFPTQEDDVERERIWTEITKLSAKIMASKTTPKDRKEWEADKSAAWLTNCGAATPSTADLAALNDLLTWLKTREPK